MRTLRTEIEIDAPPERVWQVLTDFASYPDWNPFIQRIAGPLDTGARLEVRIAPPEGRAMTFKPIVQEVEEARELRWLGRFLLPGLFDGEHSLRIEPLADGRSRFVQSERFSGLLVGLFGSTLDKTVRGFEQMNEELRRRVEAGAAPARPQRG